MAFRPPQPGDLPKRVENPILNEAPVPSMEDLAKIIELLRPFSENDRKRLVGSAAVFLRCNLNTTSSNNL